MKMTSVNKVQFAYKDENGKCKQSTVCKFKWQTICFRRNYFLPFGHPSLLSLRDLKKSYPKIHTVIEKKKQRLLKLEIKL